MPRGRYDPARFEAHYTFGEWRYYADLVRDKDYAMKKVAALGTAGFADPLKTRNIRIKLLLYNNGLPMLCSMSIEASLSVTGVMRTQVTTYSFAVQVRRANRAATLGCTAPKSLPRPGRYMAHPRSLPRPGRCMALPWSLRFPSAAQEYMPADKTFLVLLEVLLLVWTLFQLIKEAPELLESVMQGGCYAGSLEYTPLHTALGHEFSPPYRPWPRVLPSIPPLATRLRLCPPHHPVPRVPPLSVRHVSGTSPTCSTSSTGPDLG